MKDSDFSIGRRPDYVLSVLCKANEHKGRVGVAWDNPDGSISIKLNPFVVLSAADDLLVTLFVNDDKSASGAAPGTKKKEIPF